MPAKRVVLAEYFTTEDLTLLFIVRTDFEEPEVIEIKTPLDEIRQFVTVNFGAAEGGSKVRDLDLEEWQARFRPFVEPILPWTDEGDIVWLVPHDVLHYLPLHALKVEGRHLIERNPVCYTPSASVMKYCHAKRKERRERALILADSRADLPLLHAREQAVAIQQLFDPNTEVHLNGEATKALVKQRIAEAREDIDVLHFACHGYFDPYQALKSGIMLAPEGDAASGGKETSELGVDESGEGSWNLTAEEIFGLEMHADLVTLSACESGVNERRPGDELIGLTRALIYAGTPSVVVSLWSVDEISTSILMLKFYQALRAGASKAEAIQNAQIELMGMTAKDVIAYCQTAKQRLSGPEAASAQRLLDRDIADVQFAARDFDAALDGYTRLRAGLEPGDKEYHSLTVAIIRCQRALQNPQSIDYETCLYDHPYYWAPFVLVGDWK
jgi:CHAT domain-containing protein